MPTLTAVPSREILKRAPLLRAAWARLLASCTCARDDWEQCIDGRVYGPCDSERCGGACSYAGRCDCELHEHFEHDTVTLHRVEHPEFP